MSRDELVILIDALRAYRASDEDRPTVERMIHELAGCYSEDRPAALRMLFPGMRTQEAG